jgi:hypothetical protein
VGGENWRYRLSRTVEDLTVDGADADRLQQLAADSGRKI